MIFSSKMSGMKKQIFLLSLLSLSLFSCGGGDKPEELKFSVASSEVLVDIFTYKTSIELDWTPSDHIIEFSDFSFALSKQTTITPTVDVIDITARPLALNLTFNSEFNMDDQGKLKFHFNDKTAKKEGNWETKDINIKLNPYQVREDEFNNACDFKGITRMQSEANTTIVDTDGTIETVSQRFETSELICHTVEQSECYSVTLLHEEYARKDTVEADHCEYVYKEDEGEWSDPATSYELNDYPFTGHYYNPINNIGSGIYEPSIEFSNFNFIDNKYIYEGIDTSDGEIIKMELNFKNKILVNTKKHTDSDIYGTKDFEAIYLFEDIVPSWPLPE